MRLFDILGQMADGLKGICKDHGHPRGSLLTFDVTRDVVTHVYTGIVGTDCRWPERHLKRSGIPVAAEIDGAPGCAASMRQP
jgi:hypothetical protein